MQATRYLLFISGGLRANPSGPSQERPGQNYPVREKFESAGVP